MVAVSYAVQGLPCNALVPVGKNLGLGLGLGIGGVGCLPHEGMVSTALAANFCDGTSDSQLEQCFTHLPRGEVRPARRAGRLLARPIVR